METTLLDQYVNRLQNLPSFNIFKIARDGVVEPWYEVPALAVARELVIQEENLAFQVSAVPAQIMQWGRLEAQARRVWAVEERNFRIWRDKLILDLVTPPPPKKGAKADANEWKKPTEKVLEAACREHPEYAEWQNRVERAEEAYNAAHAILEGFRAKRDMLKTVVIRAQEGAAPRIAV